MDLETNKYKDFTLLVDGANAFYEIENCIMQAKKSIHINMFIWRDDDIGNCLASLILSRADNGVKVFISVDRYGVVLEKAEENKLSFFHKEQSLIEKIKITALKTVYPKNNLVKTKKDAYTDIYKKIISHPNITIEKDVFKADHSKFYIIDDQILFLGGINIEDKENGADLQGRVYQDYMVKICGKDYVQKFKDKIFNDKNFSDDYYYGVNVKKGKNKIFEMERLYLDLINSADKELTIVMAYFSPIKKFIDAIICAHNRGVKVKIMIPKCANFQNDSNYKTAKKLLKLSNGEIAVLLSPKMLHTKLIMSEKTLSFGSCNITKKAFHQLSELNLFLKNENCSIISEFRKSIEENALLCERIDSYEKIKFNKLLAVVESFLV